MPRAVPRPQRPELLSPSADAGVRGGIIATPADLGAVIRWARGVRQLTLDEVAAGTGVSQSLLRGLEKADRDVGLRAALEVVSTLGFDIVLVPRDPKLQLR